MRMTDALLGEHGVIYALFEHLETNLDSASTEEVTAQAKLLAAALGSHANLENEVLFPALEPHLGPMGPLAVMRSEHDQIESALEQAGVAEDGEQAKGLLRQVIAVARQHFAKEEQVLFVMASQALDDSQLVSLGEQWAQRREVTLPSARGGSPPCCP